MERIGINTVLDANNRLSIKADSTLLDAENESHCLVMNRTAIHDTTSLLMQTDYMGQAEFGMTGASGLALRVSADGANWSDAMVVDSATGQVAFPKSQLGDVQRVMLTLGSGTYTVPDGVRALHIEAQGAGGGGASAEPPIVDVIAGACGDAGSRGQSGDAGLLTLGTGTGGDAQLGKGGAFNNGDGRVGSGAGAGMIPRFILNRSGGDGAPGCLVITEFY